jgi:hypothetical protein
VAIAQTILNGAINAAVTSLTVRDALGFAASTETDDLILIDGEFLLVTAGMGTTTWTVTRGHSGSTAASHSDGATVTRISRRWTDLARVKRAIGMLATDTTDDLYLLDLIDAVSDEFDERVGVFLGPSTDTVRIYDGASAVRNGTRLWIPGGIRTLTQVRIADASNGTLHTATLADFVLRPHAHERRPGEPYRHVDIVPDPAGSHPWFPAYLANVELTGTYGRATVAANAASIADMVVVRIFNSRDGGALAAPSPSKFLFADDVALLDRLAAENRSRIL